jgi:hypothetical protein
MNAQRTPWDLDTRVRERNLKKGVLSEKDVEKMLKELPDLAANAETVSTPQPALAPEQSRRGEGEAPAVPSPQSGGSGPWGEGGAVPAGDQG